MSDIPPAPLGFQPVIIIAAARSGTNMLRNALTQLDGVETWPCDEINYIWRHGWATYPTDELRPEQATPRVCRYIRRAFSKLARRSGAQWVVEKTCANSLRVDFVRTVLPEAKFIFLVRDGRDVVASALRRWKAPLDLRYVLQKARYVPLVDLPGYAVRYLGHRLYRTVSRERRLATWGPRFAGIDQLFATCSLAEVCAEQWQRSVLLADAALASLPDEQVCRVQYETFVTNPREEVDRVTDWLRVPASKDQLRRIAEGISNRSIGKSRSHLSRDELETVDHRLQSALEAWGYSARRPSSAPDQRRAA